LPAAHGCVAEILLKLELANPLSSLKGRIALAMIEAAEAEGRLRPGDTLVEPTSGNTGVALAFVCAARGYRLILTMPQNMSLERRKMLRLLGAELELTPASAGMAGAIERARALVAEIDGALMLQQFDNPANPDVHDRTTGAEIWTDTGGMIDVFVCGVGTGGTLTGVARHLKAQRAAVHVVAVEPEDSAVLSGGRAGPHELQGLGAGFVPAVLDRELIDEVLSIGNEGAFAFARAAARLEGIPAGISSGATLAAAVEIAQRPAMAGKRIVTIAGSAAERYLSTDLFAER
ncbi:MAG: cysteine synthase A, partial [Pseudomonadota bacterium]